MSDKNISIRDVARKANVSISTVSRVLNGLSRVSPETRSRVQEAMEALEYRPDARGRALSSHRVGTIGLLLPDLYGDFYGKLMRAMDLATREQGIDLIIAHARNEKEYIDFAFKYLAERRTDGLIAMVTEPMKHAFKEIASMDGSAVILAADVRPHRIHNIVVDNELAGYEVGCHLIEDSGVERFYFIGGTAHNLDTCARLQGFQKALKENGRDESSLEIHHTGYSHDEARAIAKKLSVSTQRAGIFAVNDEVARGVIAGLRDMNASVPEDAFVVGFDDSILATVSSPRLTTVSYPFPEIASQALQALLDSWKTPDVSPRKMILRPELVIRESSQSAITANGKS